MPHQYSAADRRASAEIAKAAAHAGLELHGGTLRRTCSRICLGVEHGDYNGTDLFGIGVDRFLWIGYRANGTGRVRLFSCAFPDQGVVDFALGHIPPPGSSSWSQKWARYPFGVDHVLRRAGLPLGQGLDGVIYSEIPGGGMSRSASLAINLVLSLLDVNQVSANDRFKVASWARAVENDYVGSPCGLMDQVMILFAREGSATRYAPATGTLEHIPLPADAEDPVLVLLDTGTRRHGLETSTYPVRRAECERLVQILNRAGITVSTLADVTPRQYEAVRQGGIDIPVPLLKRLKYIHEASSRLDQMIPAWRQGDLGTVGRLLREDGHGLRDDYEISGPELEAMCDIARAVPGVWGERMLGGGDKGAVGAIVQRHAVSRLRYAVAKEFPSRYPELAERWSVDELQTAHGVVTFNDLSVSE